MLMSVLSKRKQIQLTNEHFFLKSIWRDQGSTEHILRKADLIHVKREEKNRILHMLSSLFTIYYPHLHKNPEIGAIIIPILTLENKTKPTMKLSIVFNLLS